MKKKLVIAVLSTLLLIGGGTTVLAAGSSDANAELKELYNQMFNLQRQIADKQAEAGMVQWCNDFGGLRGGCGMGWR